jgi:gluconate kinase
MVAERAEIEREACCAKPKAARVSSRESSRRATFVFLAAGRLSLCAHRRARDAPPTRAKMAEVDFAALELQKENCAPVKRGRNVGLAARALAAPQSTLAAETACVAAQSLRQRGCHLLLRAIYCGG